jgi:hypothetical protein
VKVIRCSFLIYSMAFSMNICILDVDLWLRSGTFSLYNLTTTSIAIEISLHTRRKRILIQKTWMLYWEEEFKWSRKIIIVTLYMYSKIASIVNEYQVLWGLFSHFLYRLGDTTSLNYWNFFLPMFWILKKSCTRLGLTWSNSTDLLIKQKQNDKGVKDMKMYIQMSSSYMRKKCLPIEVSHGSEELHESSCCVQQNGIDANVPICIIGVYLSDIWQPCLETMIFIPNMEHMS